MPRPRAALGLDIGTTATKAVVFAHGGEILGEAAREYPMRCPAPGWAEQDPEEILAAVIESVQEAILRAGLGPGDMLGVGLSAAMHSLLVLDAEDRPLTPVMVWADTRSAPQARRLREEAAGDAIYRRTGTPIHPMSPLCKLLWLREERPQLLARARHLVSLKEYVLRRLFGHSGVDVSIASASGLLDIRRLTWDDAVLELLGLSGELLAEVLPATTLLTGLDRAMADRMGLSPHVPFAIGGSDGAMANLGVGATRVGEVAVTIGTSGAIRAIADSPSTDPEGRTFCYALGDYRWLVGGATSGGGLMLRWMRDVFARPEAEAAIAAGEDPYEALIRLAEEVQAGAGGLLFLPYLSGARAPSWDPDARGAFLGLALHHTRAHAVRAVLEGVVMGLHAVALAMPTALGAGPLRASGGFARSPLWRQILADVTGRPVQVAESPEASALGAAAVAMLAVGEVGSLDEIRAWVRSLHEHPPDPGRSARYRQLYALYDRLDRSLADAHGAIADFQRATFEEETTCPCL